jgi:hypothetical protein
LRERAGSSLLQIRTLLGWLVRAEIRVYWCHSCGSPRVASQSGNEAVQRSACRRPMSALRSSNDICLIFAVALGVPLPCSWQLSRADIDTDQSTNTAKSRYGPFHCNRALMRVSRQPFLMYLYRVHPVCSDGMLSRVCGDGIPKCRHRKANLCASVQILDDRPWCRPGVARR